MSYSSSTTNQLFVTCQRGFEEILSKELTDLGLIVIEQGHSGVYIEGGFEEVYRANYGSRLASRVLMPLRSFKVTDAKDLYAKANSIQWTKYLRPDMTFAIEYNVVDHPAFNNSFYAAQVLKDALCDQIRDKFNARPSVDLKRPDIRLNLYIYKDRATVSLDTSGSPLHKRGYRSATGGAPLKETLAAGLLTLAGYQGEDLVDPCCGSGTLLVEAAWMAKNIPPGSLRHYWGFEAFPGHDAELWKSVKAEMDAKRLDTEVKLTGIDCDKAVLKMARDNIHRAGLDSCVRLLRGDLRDVQHEWDASFLITNPPYGLRMGEEETLTPLYRALGDFLKHKVSKPGRAFIFTGNLLLAKQVGLRTKRRHQVDNGGVESRLLEFEVF